MNKWLVKGGVGDEKRVVGNDGDGGVWFEVWCSILWGCVEKERKEGSDN